MRDRIARYRLRDGFQLPVPSGTAPAVDRLTASNTNELDEACYDLLASEARLTSLFAIAKGDLPTEHWYKLGRPIVPIGARGALVSWSGSMFEYLMPPLVMQERQGGILNQTNNLIVQEQMNHGRRLGTPWGISEAAFNARDHELTYQYTNFGVPTLGLKRGLGQNAVIAPYASILASSTIRRRRSTICERCASVGALGIYGFHDAVDFTPTRVPEGKTCAVVRNYYAHHHGMSIAAVANVVFNGRLRELVPRRSGDRSRRTAAAGKGAARYSDHQHQARDRNRSAKVQEDLLRPEVRDRSPIRSRKDRETVFLSNGHYCGHADGDRCRLFALERPDRLPAGRPIRPRIAPAPSSSCAIRDRRLVVGDGRTAPAKAKRSRSRFGDDKAEFIKTVGDLTSEVECIVATEHDAEGRRVILLNTGTEDRFIEVTSYAEPVLTTRRHRQRPSALCQDVPAHRDRSEGRRHPRRRATSAAPTSRTCRWPI